MTASQINSWIPSTDERNRPSFVAVFTFVVFLALIFVLYLGGDSTRTLVAAVISIIAAAAMIMAADSTSCRERGDRPFWLGVGTASSIRAIAASVAAVAFADHALNSNLQTALMVLTGSAALLLTAVLLKTSIPRTGPWSVLALDLALATMLVCLIYACALDVLGQASDARKYEIAIATISVGLNGAALVALMYTTWPMINTSSIARWILAGWILVTLADIERALSFTASGANTSAVYLLASLSAFTLGVAGVFRLSTEQTSFSKAEIEIANALRVHRHRFSMVLCALVTSACIGIILASAFERASQEHSLIAGLATAGAITGLARLVLSHSGQHSEVAQLRHRQIELEQQAMTDSITDLPNHRALLLRLNEEVERAKRFKQPLSVCFVDVDSFKQVNDSLGHQIGDAVLKEIASMLRANARQIDIVARYGGEEFVILLPGTWTDDALLFAERLREAIAITILRPREGVDIRLSVSIGVAGLPEQADDRESLLGRADDAVYIAKRSGRNQVHLFNPSISTGSGAAFTTEDALRLVSVVEQRQAMSTGHGEQVARFSALMATRLGLDASEIDRVYQAGLLHDLGKISVPDSILSKDGRLTPREADIIRGHTLIGARLLDGNPMLVPLSSAVRHHHERWDGSGYPYRLAGENIPLASRILAIAEAYAAMTTDSPWRRALASQEAVDEIVSMAGRQFDPKLVELFARMISSTPAVALT